MSQTASLAPPLATYELRFPELEMATSIVSSYVSHNPVSPDRLPDLIRSVYTTVASLTIAAQPAPEPEALVPAVPIKKSITPDYIICLEDGAKLKSLRRHLRTAFNLSPEEYRAKWGLPVDYPMVAPNYSAKRSELAKANGLGLKH